MLLLLLQHALVSNLAKLEDFSPTHAPVADATAAFQDDVYRSTIGARMAAPSDTSYRSFAPSFIDAPAVPAGVSPQTWADISHWVGEGDRTVNFVTAGEGQVPDFILGADGNLVANPMKTEPSPDGSITIQVDSNEGLMAAKKVAQQLQLASVNEKIAYWRAANPRATDIPEYLKGMLFDAQNMGGFEPVQQTPQQQIARPTPQPQEAPSQPMSRPAPVASGAGGGGGGGQRIGNSSIGDAPSGGFRRGSFEPQEPIDRSAIPKPVEGDLNIKGPPSATPEQIQTFLEKMGSPAAKEAGFSQALYDACTDRGIDPAVAVGFFLQESTCGRYGRGHDNHSMGNIKGTAPESGGTDGTFRKYDTWAEGARDWARLIDEAYVEKRGLTTLSQVISVYAPSSDGNNEAKYVATVNGVVDSFKRQNNGVAVA